MHGSTPLCTILQRGSTFKLYKGGRIYTNSAMSLITMLEINLGIAFLTSIVDIYGNKVRTVPIKSEQNIIKISVAACGPNSDNPIVSEFMDYITTNI